MANKYDNYVLVWLALAAYISFHVFMFVVLNYLAWNTNNNDGIFIFGQFSIIIVGILGLLIGFTGKDRLLQKFIDEKKKEE